MKAYIVLRNADMTEGRGPMILDNLFFDRDEALNYVLGKSGVMGRPLVDEPRSHRDYTIWAGGGTPRVLMRFEPEYPTGSMTRAVSPRLLGQIIFSSDYEVIEVER